MLEDALKEARISNGTTRFITLYRADGGMFTSPFQLLDMKYTLKKDNQKENVKAGTKISSGVNERNLSKNLDRLSVRPGGLKGLSVGLVNVNTATARVLAVLPEMFSCSFDNVCNIV